MNPELLGLRLGTGLGVRAVEATKAQPLPYVSLISNLTFTLTPNPIMHPYSCRNVCSRHT